MNNIELLKALRQAAANSKLLARIPKIVAHSFGVIPVRETDEELTLACCQGINRDCLNFLQRRLGKRIRASLSDSQLIDLFMSKIYPTKGGLNMNTFDSPDFITDEKNSASLVAEKRDDLGTIRSELALDELVILDLSYYSFLENIDHPKTESEIRIGRLDIPFRDKGDRIVVSPKPVSESVLMLVRTDSFYDGYEYIHGIAGSRVTRLPFVIHPSEIQVTRIHATGALTFYLYDNFERVEPHAAFHWQKEYYFLRSGNRFKRKLTIVVRHLRKARRSQLEYSRHSIEWTTEDLERWLRLDRPEARPNFPYEQPETTQ